jgi:SAM-dependent methyltransferase
MIKSLKAYYRKQIFFPDIFGLFINPFYFARKNLACALTKESGSINGRLLDVGCGSKPYQSIFNVDTYRGLDLDTSISRERGVAEDFYDGTRFPYQNSCFDSALCNQVLEHVFNPNEFLSEINRVLKPGGKLLLTVPFVWDEHEQPYDYARYSSFGLKSLLEKHGFEIIKHHKSVNDFGVIVQLLNVYLYKITYRIPLLRQLTTITLGAIINFLGIVISFILPKNNDLYLDNILLARKLNDI